MIVNESYVLSYLNGHVDKCSNPLELAQMYVIVEGYKDPALEGENITFVCPPGSTLNGPNSSTCMGKGEWEPNPREVNCTSRLQLVTAGTTVSCMP